MLVRARGLTKRFGDFTAVDGIDFDLYRGEAFGFLGPNGAGKSSTMRMIGCVSLAVRRGTDHPRHRPVRPPTRPAPARLTRAPSVGNDKLRGDAGTATDSV